MGLGAEVPSSSPDSERNQSLTSSHIPHTGHGFGAFGGVFTPSILTIFGVIMFMRAGWVTGQAGILAALGILAISKTITLLTACSISAISSNTPVGGGGAYFLISRSLGPAFGGTIGVALFLAQSLSVPFYILGFAEALVLSNPELLPYFLWITILTAVVLFAVTWIGAGWAIKVQYFILAAMGLAILCFMTGSAQQFSTATFEANLRPAKGVHFWHIFAIYFPAVTGIMAGVNMSGDLKDPGKSIPRGTFAAVFVGAAVYAIQILVVGGATTREALIGQPFESLQNNALFKLGLLVSAGVYCATLSSAVGSFMGAPRILQAFARDRLLPFLNVFSAGSGPNDEPRRALSLTMAITFVVLFAAGSGTEGGAFDLVASMVTMFFLFTYGMVNLAAFVESFGMNPSFRPRFKIYHWSTALVGTLGCAGAAFLINPLSAAFAAMVIAGLYAFIQRSVLNITFGDARRGFVYARVRQGLLGLKYMPAHPKNWRPTLLVFSGNPSSRLTLVTYAVWFECQRGILSLVEFLVGKYAQLAERRAAALGRLDEFVKEQDIDAFTEAVIVDEFYSGVETFLQSHSIGPIKPNLVMIGWSHLKENAESFYRVLRTVIGLEKSALVLTDKGLPRGGRRRRIDLWWRGQRNGSLMLILAYMLSRNPGWRRAEIRVLRLVQDEADRQPATDALNQLIHAARVDATVKVVVSSDSFANVLHQQSGKSTVVLLGLALEIDEDPQVFHARYHELLKDLPTTILVASSGQADLLA